MSASNAGPRFNGWRRNATGGLTINVGGTVVATAAAASFAVTGGITASTTIASTTTMTAGTGLTVTTGDAAVTAGNVRLGAISAFTTTEPTSAIVFKQGTAFAGAITTSSGLQASATVLRKIIADGTVSNVET